MLKKPDNSQVLIITSFCLANWDCNQSHNTHHDTQHGAKRLYCSYYICIHLKNQTTTKLNFSLHGQELL